MVLVYHLYLILQSDNASENKVKTKRKPSLNLGNLLLGKFRDASDEYLLSPRGSRRKPDIIHLVWSYSCYADFC